MQKPRIGISSCLLGNRVRYDGQGKLQPDLVDWLRDAAELAPVCPEVAIGLGIPRPPIQLCDDLARPEARQVGRPDRLFTRPLREFGYAVADQYCLDGYIFKSRSPSCGLRSTPVFIEGKIQQQTVSGIFASTLIQSLPGLPVAEETSLSTAAKCQLFLEQCRRHQGLKLGLRIKGSY